RADRTGRYGGRPQLGSLERRLALAVAALDGGLAGERAAVLLEVEVAGPHRQWRRVGLDRGEELLRGFEGHGRGAGEVAGPAGRLEHLAGWATAPVAVAEGIDRPGGPGAAQQLPRRHVAVVGVGGREVGPHPGAVDALPPEGVVGEAVG